MAKYKIPKIQDMIENGVHFGHQVKRWHPNMEPYIYTVKKNVHIIDLEQTERLLKEAAEFLYEIAKKGGKIIFIGTKKQARDIIQNEAGRAGALYVNERWLGGTFSNFEVIKKNNIDKLLSLKNRKEKGELDVYTKKERLLIDREIEKLERYVGGLTTMTKIPEAVFVVDGKREKTAVRDARRANVKVVALIDTNTDPNTIDYPIPGNDDAIRSIAVVTRAIADAVEEGYVEFAKEIKVSGEKQVEKAETKEEAGKKEKSDESETAKHTQDEKPKKRGRPKKE